MSQVENRIKELSIEDFAKGVRPYQNNNQRQALDRDVEHQLFVKEYDTDLESTIVFDDPSKGQEITLKQFASFLVKDGTKTVEDKNNDCKVVPLGNGNTKLVWDVVKEKGMPSAFIMDGEVVYQGATKAYLENKDQGALRVEAYKALDISTEGENFPQIIQRKSSKSGADAENWRQIPASIVTLVYK